MRQLQLLLLLGIVLLAAPALLSADDKGKGDSKPPDLVFVAEDDAKMNEAMEKARKSIDDFIKVLQKPNKDQSDFGVKVQIRDGKKVEHFWVKTTKYDGKQFEGTISNDPMLVKTVKFGDKIKVDRDKIGDWMYVEKKKLVGGFTVRVLRDRLTPAERKELDDSLPYKIE